MKKIGMSLAVVVVGVVAAWIVGCETSSTVSYAPVKIDPTSESIAVGTETNATEFTASGGDGSYRWSVEDVQLGTLTISNNVAWYLHTMAVGRNRITVNSNGENATATVDQH